MDFEERYATATPEGVAIELLLAGVASRIAAFAIDTVVIVAATALLSLMVALLAVVVKSSLVADVGVAVASIGGLVAELGGYFLLFEVLGGGTSLGKRAVGLRVVDVAGGPLGFRRSLVRNVLRLVDALPAAYVVGLVAVFVSRNHQRLGDLAAGTLVVRAQPFRRVPATVPAAAVAALPRSPGVGWAGSGWDVTAVTADEIAVVRQFLERRAQLPPGARYSIATDLAGRLSPKVAGQPAGLEPEYFLELLAWEKLSGA